MNTKLGESWEDQAGDTVPADPLMARREDWGSDLAPGVAVLTAGVDVQGDRIEVQIVGWGRDEEAWVTDYRVLWGDPSGPRLWSDLDGVLNGTWGDLPVRAVAVDTGGHHTKMAYEFCRTRLARRVWAIKGRGGPGIPVWPRRPIRSWQPKRDGERNEALDTFVYAHAALHGLISMGMRLNEEAEGPVSPPVTHGAAPTRAIRSAWMG